MIGPNEILSEWRKVLSQLVGVPMPTSCTWTRPDDIAGVLDALCVIPKLANVFLSRPAWFALDGVDQQDTVIVLREGKYPRYIYPAIVRLEVLPWNYAFSFFRIETRDTTTTAGSSRTQEYESGPIVIFCGASPYCTDGAMPSFDALHTKTDANSFRTLVETLASQYQSSLPRPL